MQVVRLALGALSLALSGCLASSPPPPEAPSVVLVSIDGWRWDYLDWVDAPNLRRLAAKGVRSEGLVPVFPTLTFPNHYTVVTGLRPARHGIVSNTMLDPDIPGRFTLSNTRVTGNPAWWGGEPIWHTATRQGQRSATMFWPGSDVAVGGGYPTYWRPFEDALPASKRTDQILDWLRLPEAERPSLLTLYYSDVDTAGHDFGAESDELRAAAALVDREIGRLIAGVEAMGLQSRVHWVVTSDHGMAPLSADRLILLDDYLDVSSVQIVETGSALTMNPGTSSIDAIVAALAGRHPRLRVYRSADLPARYGVAGHPRVPAVVALADEGWSVTTRERLARRDPARPWGGAHGFDPDARPMRGLLVAAGPRIQAGRVVPPVENVHLYEFMCALLGLKPAPNDGNPSATRGWFK